MAKTWTLKAGKHDDGTERIITVKALKADVARLQDALHTVINIWQYQREITGIHGNHDPNDYNRENSHTMMTLFGGNYPPRDLDTYNMKKAELFSAMQGTITADRIPAFMAMCKNIFNQHVCELDNRKTAEEHAAEEDERRAAYAEREAKHNAEETHRAKTRATITANPQYKHLTPLTAEPGKSSYAIAAANIKTELTRAFPGVVFSVRSSSFSMGNDIVVSWTDGPTTKQVKDIADKYQQGSFDGMTDMYNYHHSDFLDVFGGSKYVQESRHYSPAAVQDAIDHLWTEYAADITANNPAGTEKPTPEDFKQGNCFRIITHDYPHETLNELIHRHLDDLDLTPPTPDPGSGPQDNGSGTTNGNATMKLNAAKNGVEIKFREKPDSGTLDTLKASGFRWSKFQKLWYARQSPRTLALARQITGTTDEQDDDPEGRNTAAYVEAQENAYLDNIAASIGA